MTKEVLIEMVKQGIFKVSTVENEIFPAFIAKYIGPAVNYALTKEYYTQLQDPDMEGKDYPTTFLYKTEASAVWDDNRKQYYMDLPVKVAKLPRDRGLQYLGPRQGENNMFINMGGMTGQLLLTDDILQMTDRVYYRLEGAKQVRFTNLDATGPFLILMVIDSEDLGSKDEVPIPAGSEKDVIDIMVQFWLGKRKLPEAALVDDDDLR